MPTPALASATEDNVTLTEKIGHLRTQIGASDKLEELLSDQLTPQSQAAQFVFLTLLSNILSSYWFDEEVVIDDNKTFSRRNLLPKDNLRDRVAMQLVAGTDTLTYDPFIGCDDQQQGILTVKHADVLTLTVETLDKTFACDSQGNVFSIANFLGQPYKIVVPTPTSADKYATKTFEGQYNYGTFSPLGARPNKIEEMLPEAKNKIEHITLANCNFELVQAFLQCDPYTTALTEFNRLITQSPEILDLATTDPSLIKFLLELTKSPRIEPAAALRFINFPLVKNFLQAKKTLAFDLIFFLLQNINSLSLESFNGHTDAGVNQLLTAWATCPDESIKFQLRLLTFCAEKTPGDLTLDFCLTLCQTNMLETLDNDVFSNDSQQRIKIFFLLLNLGQPISECYKIFKLPLTAEFLANYNPQINYLALAVADINHCSIIEALQLIQHPEACLDLIKTKPLLSALFLQLQLFYIAPYQFSAAICCELLNISGHASEQAFQQAIAINFLAEQKPFAENDWRIEYIRSIQTNAKMFLFYLQHCFHRFPNEVRGQLIANNIGNPHLAEAITQMLLERATAADGTTWLINQPRELATVYIDLIVDRLPQSIVRALNAQADFNRIPSLQRRITAMDNPVNIAFDFSGPLPPLTRKQQDLLQKLKEQQRNLTDLKAKIQRIVTEYAAKELNYEMGKYSSKVFHGSEDRALVVNQILYLLNQENFPAEIKKYIQSNPTLIGTNVFYKVCQQILEETERYNKKAALIQKEVDQANIYQDGRLIAEILLIPELRRVLRENQLQQMLSNKPKVFAKVMQHIKLGSTLLGLAPSDYEKTAKAANAQNELAQILRSKRLSWPMPAAAADTSWESLAQRIVSELRGNITDFTHIYEIAHNLLISPIGDYHEAYAQLNPEDQSKLREKILFALHVEETRKKLEDYLIAQFSAILTEQADLPESEQEVIEQLHQRLLVEKAADCAALNAEDASLSLQISTIAVAKSIENFVAHITSKIETCLTQTTILDSFITMMFECEDDSVLAERLYTLFSLNFQLNAITRNQLLAISQRQLEKHFNQWVDLQINLVKKDPRAQVCTPSSVQVTSCATEQSFTMVSSEEELKLTDFTLAFATPHAVKAVLQSKKHFTSLQKKVDLLKSETTIPVKVMQQFESIMNSCILFEKQLFALTKLQQQMPEEKIAVKYSELLSRFIKTASVYVMLHLQNASFKNLEATLAVVSEEIHATILSIYEMILTDDKEFNLSENYQEIIFQHICLALNYKWPNQPLPATVTQEEKELLILALRQDVKTRLQLAQKRTITLSASIKLDLPEESQTQMRQEPSSAELASNQTSQATSLKLRYVIEELKKAADIQSNLEYQKDLIEIKRAESKLTQETDHGTISIIKSGLETARARARLQHELLTHIADTCEALAAVGGMDTPIENCMDAIQDILQALFAKISQIAPPATTYMGHQPSEEIKALLKLLAELNQRNLLKLGEKSYYQWLMPQVANACDLSGYKLEVNPLDSYVYVNSEPAFLLLASDLCKTMIERGLEVCINPYNNKPISEKCLLGSADALNLIQLQKAIIVNHRLGNITLKPETLTIVINFVNASIKDKARTGFYDATEDRIALEGLKTFIEAIQTLPYDQQMALLSYRPIDLDMGTLLKTSGASCISGFGKHVVKLLFDHFDFNDWAFSRRLQDQALLTWPGPTMYKWTKKTQKEAPKTYCELFGGKILAAAVLRIIYYYHQTSVGKTIADNLGLPRSKTQPKPCQPALALAEKIQQALLDPGTSLKSHEREKKLYDAIVDGIRMLPIDQFEPSSHPFARFSKTQWQSLQALLRKETATAGSQYQMLATTVLAALTDAKNDHRNIVLNHDAIIKLQKLLTDNALPQLSERIAISEERMLYNRLRQLILPPSLKKALETDASTRQPVSANGAAAAEDESIIEEEMDPKEIDTKLLELAISSQEVDCYFKEYIHFKRSVAFSMVQNNITQALVEFRAPVNCEAFFQMLRLQRQLIAALQQAYIQENQTLSIEFMRKVRQEIITPYKGLTLYSSSIQFRNKVDAIDRNFTETPLLVM